MSELHTICSGTRLYISAHFLLENRKRAGGLSTSHTLSHRPRLIRRIAVYILTVISAYAGSTRHPEEKNCWDSCSYLSPSVRHRLSPLSTLRLCSFFALLHARRIRSRKHFACGRVNFKIVISKQKYLPIVAFKHDHLALTHHALCIRQLNVWKK